jgi:hypothetical protein
MAEILRRGFHADHEIDSAGEILFSGGWIPGLLRCNCGATIDMGGPGDDVDCDACGRTFNSGGQELAPREQWGAETGEHPADLGRPHRNPFDDLPGIHDTDWEW